jgi:hypothetical protein
MAPFSQPTCARRDVELERDLARPDFGPKGCGLDARRREPPNGRREHLTGQGEATVEAPPDVRPMTRDLPTDLVAELSALPEEEGPFNPHLSLGHLPLAGHIVYSLDPRWIRLQKSWAATSRTYVEFEGQTAYGEQSRVPFHVTSVDWQENRRSGDDHLRPLIARTMAFMRSMGLFDLQAPLHSGMAARGPQAWVVWGTGRAAINSYAFVSNATLTAGPEIRADGQFSSFPGAMKTRSTQTADPPSVADRARLRSRRPPIEARFRARSAAGRPDAVALAASDRQGTAYGDVRRWPPCRRLRKRASAWT